MPTVAQLCKDEVLPRHRPERHNHCRDTLCILIFGAFWAFLVLMFGSWAYDINRLVYPSDYNDFLCGVNTGDLSSDGGIGRVGNRRRAVYGLSAPCGRRPP